MFERSELHGGHGGARRLREAVRRIGERVRQVRAARQDDARRTHHGSDSEQFGSVRGRVATQHLARGAFATE